MKSDSDVCVSMHVLQGTEEKRLSSSARPAEAVGLVLRTGADDISPLEGGDWPTRQDRARGVKR